MIYKKNESTLDILSLKNLFDMISTYFRGLLTTTQINQFFISSKLASLKFNDREIEGDFPIDYKDLYQEIVSNKSLRNLIWSALDYVICWMFLSFPMMANTNPDFVELTYQVRFTYHLTCCFQIILTCQLHIT